MEEFRQKLISGNVFPSDDIASMGAQTSGASLMEGVVRLEAVQVK